MKKRTSHIAQTGLAILAGFLLMADVQARGPGDGMGQGQGPRQDCPQAQTNCRRAVSVQSGQTVQTPQQNRVQQQNTLQDGTGAMARQRQLNRQQSAPAPTTP